MSVTLSDNLLLLDLRDNEDVFNALLKNRPLLERVRAAVLEIQNQRANLKASE